MPISEPRSLDPHLGSVLQNRYRILAEIASGAMGVVYRGERVGLERRVAVKFLHPWIASQQAFLDRFDNEARAMSRLGHPNCVSVIDFGVEGEPYLVMDFVTGRTLRAVLNDGGRQPPSRALHVIRQLLSGLRHAHTQGIVHRDLKPENLILTDEAGLPDHLRILDFGLAKLRDGPATTTGLAIGTPSYMSPEQGGAEGATDARSDLYSVGVLLFELLTGRKPFESPNIGDLIFMHRETAAPRVRALAPEAGLSAELEAVIWKAMAKRQDDRFQSAAELADALDGTPEGSARRYVAYAVAPIPSAAAAPSNPCPVDATTVDATTVDATWPAPVPADETPRPRSSSRQFRFTRRDLIAGAGLVALGIVAVALEMFAR